MTKEELIECKNHLELLKSEIEWDKPIGYQIDLDMAIEALEKQIPKKPIGDLHSVPHYRCPACKANVKTYEDSAEIPFCCWCGQQLDWSAK